MIKNGKLMNLLNSFIKRITDISISVIGLLVISPLFLLIMLIIYLYDRHSPFYITTRIGKDGKPFKFIKFRSMIVNADKAHVFSTSASDPRITPIGKFVRKYKFDELPQLINVLRGDMTLVGPRPNVPSEVALYTSEEKKMLSVLPGITDFASIVFSDENDILKDSKDPDKDYNLKIRPWKSRLGILYIRNQSLILDFKIIFYTAIALFSRKIALQKIQKIVAKLTTDKELIKISGRETELYPYFPPSTPCAN